MMTDAMAYVEPPPWCKSPFSAGELHGKSVAFKLQTNKGTEAGNGKFIAEANKGGFIRVAVAFVRFSVNCSDLAQSSLPGGLWEFLPLDQAAVDMILKNSKSAEC